MQTILTYRFPNQEPVKKIGVFKKLKHRELFEGFVVSDFEGTDLYGFYEGETDEPFVETQAPVVIAKSAYCDLAHEFIHYLQDFDIGKAVLSRVKKVSFDEHQRLELFHKLVEHYPTAFCYTFDSPSLGKWIGATPETLVEITQGKGKSMSLAGTKKASDTTPWEEKEIYEQQLVTDFISENLSAVCEKVNVSEHQELEAGPVKHLVHHFEFEVKPSKINELINTLHPTPAVSGFPREKALKCIYNFEPHERRFYTGIIGFTSTDFTRLFVNLRCAQLSENHLYIYVGGGLTQQSVPESEWEETENKSETLLNLIHK